MNKIIEINGFIYGVIIDANKISLGVNFVTSGKNNLEVGLMAHPAGFNVDPHFHLPVERITYGTQEVLYIKKGSVMVEFFDDMKQKIGDETLFEGQLILLTAGGHGFKMLEQTEIIEVKNGPYTEGKDKQKFVARK